MYCAYRAMAYDLHLKAVYRSYIFIAILRNLWFTIVWPCWRILPSFYLPFCCLVLRALFHRFAIYNLFSWFRFFRRFMWKLRTKIILFFDHLLLLSISSRVLFELKSRKYIANGDGEWCAQKTASTADDSSEFRKNDILCVAWCVRRGSFASRTKWKCPEMTVNGRDREQQRM